MLLFVKKSHAIKEVFPCFVCQFEADRRAFIITINSFGTELSKEDRAKLFPHCGKLYPEGLAQLARADDYEQVKAVADYYPVSIYVSSMHTSCCLLIHQLISSQDSLRDDI